MRRTALELLAHCRHCDEVNGSASPARIACNRSLNLVSMCSVQYVCETFVVQTEKGGHHDLTARC